MSTSSHREDHEPMSVLYEASYTGNVSILNSLIQQNPLILFKISQTSFTETPLHISALLGHFDFTKTLLSHNPDLALELDSSGSTPLHVASAKGHVEIVKELLKAKSEACLFADKEGRIPLHYAAMRGRTEVVRELVRAKPKSLSSGDNGKSVFYLCVTYNQLETLKALVELELHFTGKLLNFTSPDMNGGNTVLHLAIMLKQVKVVRYLVTSSEIREAAGKKNKMGLTVQDMVKHSPKDDFKILEIQVMLMNAGIIKIEDEEASDGKIGNIDLHLPSAVIVESTTCNNNNNAADQVDQKENWYIKKLKSIGCWLLWILKSIVKWFEHEEKWMKEMRGNLSLVSTVIATITFQALTNPPGSFIQQGLLKDQDTSSSPSSSLAPSPSSSITTALNCARIDGHKFCPGQPVLSVHHSDDFLYYIICNTISFVSSLSVTLLLVSGFPLKNKALIWLLSLGLCVTLSSLALSYLFAISMMIPDNVLDRTDEKIYSWTLETWACLLGLIGVFLTIRFFIWVFKICKCKDLIKSLLKLAKKGKRRMLLMIAQHA